MAASCKKMTTFTVCCGAYHILVTPFVPTNAPSTFQGMMYVVTQDPPFVTVSIDDVGSSKSMEEHVGQIREGAQRRSDHGLEIKLSKCHFAQSTIPLLGHVISSGGIQVNYCKTDAIKNSAAPTTTTEERFFPGLPEYYRRFNRRFAKMSSVLHAGISEIAPLD